MNDIVFNPYIFFRGDCREAMEFYKAIFGGELTIQTYDEVPGPTQAGMEGKVMHASLSGGLISLMGSDTEQASEKAAKITLSLGGSSEEKLTSLFNQLSDGGEIISNLKKEFWGDTFGNLTDKYGIEWMVNISAKKE